jgi:hypothetical protein
MYRPLSSDHPIRIFFAQALHECLNERSSSGEEGAGAVESYLVDMLVRFLHQDGIHAIRDATGRQVTSIPELLAEGDIRLRADSFERERQVHRHIGDFLLFWSGMFPESMPMMAAQSGLDSILDPVGQGRMSYRVASTFDHPPHEQEASIFRSLSDGFEHYRYGLTLVRSEFIARG